MASYNNLPNGIGGTSGAALAKAKPLLTSGNVWYVHSGTGTDDATHGKDRLTPLASLEYCVKNVAYASHDIVVLMSGHMETPIASIDTGAAGTKHGVSVIGEGTGANMPRLIRGIDDELLNVTGNAVTLSNICFPESTLTTVTYKVVFYGTDPAINGCLFKGGIKDGAALVRFYGAGSSTHIIRDSIFSSVAPDPTAQPAAAIEVNSATLPLVMDNVTIDGGDSGWSDLTYGAVRIKIPANVRATDIKLLNGSDVHIATACTGYFNVSQATGSSKVVWTA